MDDTDFGHSSFTSSDEEGPALGIGGCASSDTDSDRSRCEGVGGSCVMAALVCSSVTWRSNDRVNYYPKDIYLGHTHLVLVFFDATSGSP